MTSLSLLEISLLMQSSILLALFATAAHWPLRLSCLSPRCPGPFPQSCSPTCAAFLVSVFPDARWYICLHWRSLLAHSFCLSMFSCRVVLPKCPAPFGLVSSSHLIRVHLIPSSRSLLKILNSFRLSWQAASLKRSYLPPSSGCCLTVSCCSPHRPFVWTITRWVLLE